jgi:aryl-alcohol dehydrogenase-like predicted oxidoreductase
MIAGNATAEGTARYARRFPALEGAGHFRQQRHVPTAGDLWLSSLGLGTYLGEPDDAADRAYEEAIAVALRGGVSLLDTAINYRHQRSERNLGTVLGRMIGAGELRRDEVVVCTKAGYLSFDGAVPADPRGYFAREYLESGVIQPGEIAGGMHCMAPVYLENQLERSRRNLGLECIDVFYVHNPESQLGDVEEPELYARLRKAFEFLERAVADRKIQWYGVATWNAFRMPAGERGGVRLAEVLKAARAVGGDDHHLRFIQMPFNLAMPEGLLMKNQGGEGEPLSPFEMAWREGVAVIGSAALYQAQLTRGLPKWIGESLNTPDDTATALQFARSAPGLAAALVGMGRAEHVRENLRVAAMPPASEEQWVKLFQRP